MTPKRERYSRWLKGTGIEIGALHNPLRVPPGVCVRYVDRLRETELAQHYPEYAAGLVPVSMVAGAENLSPIADSSQDFVIANHLLEHLEDPIRGLEEFARVLRPDGVLYLALPDQRQTFDWERQLTTEKHLFDEHRNGPEANRRAHYEDWAINVDHQEAPAAEYVDHQMEIGYSIHFHVWRPESFVEFFLAARREFGLDLELAALAGPEAEDDNEFIVILLKGRPDRARVPPPPPLPAVPAETAARRLRRRLAAGPLGPPVRWGRRRLRPGQTSGGGAA